MAAEDEEYFEERFSDEDDQEELETNNVVINSLIRKKSEGNTKRNEVVRELIKCFSSMVRSHVVPSATPDHKGRYHQKDMTYSKLFDASKYVVRAKSALLKNENWDLREFTVFIAKKKWVKEIVCPLLELCSKDDSTLAMRITGLLLVLVKRMSDKTSKALEALQKNSKNKLKARSGEASEAVMDALSNGVLIGSQTISDQIWALLTFKEALCSEKANEAVANAFKELWEKEQLASDEDNKRGVAMCFSYLRRILAINAHPLFSTPGEHIQNKIAHNKFVLQLRHMLAVIPGIVGDILNPYHSEWLTDIILILYFVLNGFEASEFFAVWKSGALLDEDAVVADPADDVRARRLTGSSAAGSGPKKVQVQQQQQQQQPVVVPSALARALTASANGGLSLADKLKKERSSRVTMVRSQGIVAGRVAKSMFWQAPSDIMKPGSGGRSAAAADAAAEAAVSRDLPPDLFDNMGGAGAGAREQGGNVQGEGEVAKTQAELNLEQNKKKGISVLSQPVNSIVRDPFASNAGDRLPQAKTKRSKKNLTFKLDNPQVQAAVSAAITGAAGGAECAPHRQKACVVAATLAHSLTNDVVLSSLVKRVNEDLRRDENRVGPYHELRYFDVVAKILHYNRMLLEDEYCKYEFENALVSGPAASHTAAVLGYNMSRHSPGSSSSEMRNLSDLVSAPLPTPAVWEPNFKNVIGSLDKMSFSRVVSAIDRLLKPSSQLSSTVFSRVEEEAPVAILAPMMLYKEMIAYLRLMLLSGLEGHHEIAVAALYRLFYATSERLDPLPKLLAAWKPGVFPKKFLDVLLDIVHATMNTLDAARDRFKAEQSGTSPEELDKLQQQIIARRRKARQKASKGKNMRHDMDMEQYLLASMRFSVDDYFRSRMVNNHTVRMYTRVLALYKENSVETNRNVFAFLRRMCQFRLSNATDTLFSAGAYSSLASVAGTSEANLGFMLFNIQTLCVFNSILNDPEINSTAHASERRPLINLIRSVVRQFGELAAKNHMLYVEVLFQHPHPANHCISLASVYDAADHMYSRRVSSSSRARPHGEDFNSEDSDAPVELPRGRRRTDKRPKFSKSKRSSLSDTESSAKDTDSSSGSENSGNEENKGGDRSEEEEFDESAPTAEAVAAAAERRATKAAIISRKDSSSKKNRALGSRTISSLEKRKAKEEDLAARTLEKGRVALAKAAERRKRMAEEVQAAAWSTEEDAVLKNLYDLYRGSRSLFASITHSEQLKKFGKNRSEAQVERRAARLNLHLAGQSDGSDNEGETRSTMKDRIFLSDSEDETYPFGGPAKNITNKRGSLLDDVDIDRIEEENVMRKKKLVKKSRRSEKLNMDSEDDFLSDGDTGDPPMGLNTSTDSTFFDPPIPSLSRQHPPLHPRRKNTALDSSGDEDFETQSQGASGVLKRKNSLLNSSADYLTDGNTSTDISPATAAVFEKFSIDSASKQADALNDIQSHKRAKTEDDSFDDAQ